MSQKELIDSHASGGKNLADVIVNSSPNAIITIDARCVIQSFNPTAEKMFGYSASEIVGKNISLLMPEPYRSAHDKFVRRYQNTGCARIINKAGRELIGLQKSGISFPIELMVTEMQVGSEKHYLGFIHDITQRREREQEIDFIRSHDRTGLINRPCFMMCLEEIIADQRAFILFYLGVDRFQSINEVLGHVTGDQVLVKIGKRLKAMVPKGSVVGHIGGSGFAVAWVNAGGDVDVLDTVNLIHDALARPLQLKDFSVETEASIGIVCYPEHGNNPEALLRCSQMAMQSARRMQEMHAIYDHAMEQHQLESLSLASELRHAIEAGELVVYYQPKVDIRSATTIGAEALVRWQHPEKGMIQPDIFIPLAEESGIIHPFTAWLVDTVAAQVGEWRQKGISLVVAINLAPRNLLEADLPERLKEAIVKWNVPPEQFMMEITERGVITEPKRVLDTLQRMHDIGLPISIDDFGTGYSSLSYLKDMPVNELKIDQSFIGAMENDANSLTIVQTVIQMSHFLGYKVVAEGVETQEEWRRLEVMGCDKAQGYYMGRPMPAVDLERWLSESPWGSA